MVGIAGDAVTGKRRMDTGAARSGMLRRFQNEDHRPFGEHQSAPAAGKRPAAAADVVRIGPGQRPQAVPGAHDRCIERGLAAAGDRHVEIAMANPAHGIADRHAGRGAGRGMGDHGAGNLVADGNPCGRRVVHAGHEGEGTGGLLASGRMVAQPLGLGIGTAADGTRKNPRAQAEVAKT